MPAAEDGGRRARNAVAGLAAALTCAATLITIPLALSAAGIPTGRVGISLGMFLSGQIDALGGRPEEPIERIGVLGDSTVIEYPAGSTLPDLIRHSLRRLVSRPIRVAPVAAPGVAAFEQYALADRLSRVRPDQLVVPINLASFSLQWRARFGRPETVGWVAVRRLPDLLSRPFQGWGLTLDRILLYQGIVGLDLARAWQSLGYSQVRAVRGLKRARRILQRHPRTPGDGLPFEPSPFHPTIEGRPSVHHVRALYGAALAGIEPSHPVARFLDGSLAEYHRAGVRLLTYTVPMNVEHFERLGLDTRTGIAKTVETLRDLTEAHGGRFLDLHRLVPDQGFTDLEGHLVQRDGADGVQLLADLLTRELVRRSDPVAEPR